MNVSGVNGKRNISFLLLLYTAGEYTVLGNSESKTALLIREMFLKYVTFFIYKPNARQAPFTDEGA